MRCLWTILQNESCPLTGRLRNKVPQATLTLSLLQQQAHTTSRIL